MVRRGQGAPRRAGYFPRVVLATLVVTVLPGLVAAALQATGTIHGWLPSAAVAVVLSMALAAVGSAWWARRPAARDIVFADLMLWGWLRRVRTERRLASARGLLGQSADFDPARKAALLERLSGALESRDLYTHGHSRRVTRHSYRIARQLGVSPVDAARIRTAAALHDVGKIETPREVLNKPERLTDEEFAVIKRHPVDGAALVAELGDDELTAMVRHHHERLDGGGYPDGLVGGAIPLGARVIAVADTFDALTSNRPYRIGCRHKKALDILRAEAGTQLDADVVGAFLSYYSGRRALPWWSAVAEAPGRLAAWALGGLQGATAAPLSGGASSLGAAFLVGATLAGGAPATGEVAGSLNASANILPAAGVAPASDRGAPLGASGESGAADPGPGRSAPGEDGSPERSRHGTDGDRSLAHGQGVPAASGEDVPEVGSHGGTVPGGGDSGGGDSGGGDSGGGGSGVRGSGGDPGGDRALKLPDTSSPGPLSSSGGKDDDDDDDAGRPNRDAEEPEDDEPEVHEREAEESRPEVPKVKLPKVKLPKVKTPKVDLPEVEPPKLKAPKVEAPKVKAPKVEPPKGPKGELPEVELPKLKMPKVEPPDVELPPVEAEVEGPKVLPKVELKPPKVEVKLPRPRGP